MMGRPIHTLLCLILTVFFVVETKLGSDFDPGQFDSHLLPQPEGKVVLILLGKGDGKDLTREYGAHVGRPAYRTRSDASHAEAFAIQSDSGVTYYDLRYPTIPAWRRR